MKYVCLRIQGFYEDVGLENEAPVTVHGTIWAVGGSVDLPQEICGFRPPADKSLNNFSASFRTLNLVFMSIARTCPGRVKYKSVVYNDFRFREPLHDVLSESKPLNFIEWQSIVLGKRADPSAAPTGVLKWPM